MPDQPAAPTPPAPEKGTPFYIKPKFIMGAIAAVIFLILMFQNWNAIAISIFFWETTLPAAVLFIIFALIGFGVGFIVARSHSVKAAKRGQQK